MGNKPFRVLGKVSASPGRRRGSAPSKRVPHTESANSYPSYLRSTTNAPSGKVTLHRVGLLNATWLKRCGLGNVRGGISALQQLRPQTSLRQKRITSSVSRIKHHVVVPLTKSFISEVALLKTHVTSALDLLRAGMTPSVDAVGKSRNWLLNTDVSEDNQK
ncbi:hypothetical protein CEXT_185881 [Caerostris extrusa]|uniref:Uncharacterized protein n=1 Tax=Caerostris extrusa TaxID=172846 RepID=A0AAV4MG69_CAEEX|nr:hypothetical protein CEXT_185881 [Caerostris extrusa]